jgi:DDE family transposase
VTNWAAYDIALRQRGSLTVWFTEAAIAAWKAEPRATRGGQPRYSPLAITTALTSSPSRSELISSRIPLGSKK